MYLKHLDYLCIIQFQFVRTNLYIKKTTRPNHYRKYQNDMPIPLIPSVVISTSTLALALTDLGEIKSAALVPEVGSQALRTCCFSSP